MNFTTDELRILKAALDLSIHEYRHAQQWDYENEFVTKERDAAALLARFA